VVTSDVMEPETVGISSKMMGRAGLSHNAIVEIVETSGNRLVPIIHKKMDNEILSKSEIREIITAVDQGLISEIQIAALATSIEIRGLTLKETVDFASMVAENSQRLELSGKTVVDKHSIGGIAGNRITPIMIPIIAAAGLTIPKVSTRAITSPAGTIDVLETVMPVDLTIEEATSVVDTTGGCIINGEAVGLGRTMDKIIQVLKPLKIDPQALMVASILAKKKAAGSQYVMIDLPTGKGAKLPRSTDARELAHNFSTVGHQLGLKVESVISPGDKPIGSYIGPTLEMYDAMLILEQEGGSPDLRRKSLALAGIIFEMANRCERGTGYALAEQILEEGKALAKFREIVEAQGGDPAITATDLPVANYSEVVSFQGDEDVVYNVSSSAIGSIARTAGAPMDKTAGIIIHASRGSYIHRGDPLFEIRASSSSKLAEALHLSEMLHPITLEKMILEHIKSFEKTEPRV
ncbi:MAG: thymidine phosphorylase, partial [Candidatus Heimdallarchaeota archaeon]|nr:thymidine phosphorylase [Candidatus Heimdallarchaeota archaeon]MCK5049527.1 thymidine phosphorylase [Candidatus Heimdallarchaeota archaeon]